METPGQRIGRILLIAFYLLAGVMHFVVTEAMVRIVPPIVPEPALVVRLTGACEIAGALALMVPRLRRAAGWALAAYALCVWPANAYHAIIDLGAGTGLPLAYHLPRLLLQPAIIWWALWASGAWRRGEPQP